MTETHSKVPLFQLEGADGRRYGTEDLWQRKEMLVALLHGEACARCRELRELLAAGEDEWRRQGLGLVLVELAPEGEEAPVSVRLARAFGVRVGEASLGVVDRFGEVYASLEAHARPAREVLTEALEWVDFIQRQCPECFAPVDWA